MFAPGPTSQRQYAKGVGGVFVVSVASLFLISTWRTLNLEALGQFQKSSMTNAQPHKIEFGCTPENFVQSPRECERGLQESNQMMAWIRDQPAFGVGVWKSVDNQVLDNVSIAVVKPSCKVAMHRLEQSIPGFRFTSTAEALRMLSNKHIVLLGDSLMRGTYYDICARQTPKTSLLLRLELQISLM
jgi:hypothetical protein